MEASCLVAENRISRRLTSPFCLISPSRQAPLSTSLILCFYPRTETLEPALHKRIVYIQYCLDEPHPAVRRKLPHGRETRRSGRRRYPGLFLYLDRCGGASASTAKSPGLGRVKNPLLRRCGVRRGSTQQFPEKSRTSSRWTLAAPTSDVYHNLSSDVTPLVIAFIEPQRNNTEVLWVS